MVLRENILVFDGDFASLNTYTADLPPLYRNLQESTGIPSKYVILNFYFRKTAWLSQIFY